MDNVNQDLNNIKFRHTTGCGMCQSKDAMEDIYSWGYVVENSWMKTNRFKMSSLLT